MNTPQTPENVGNEPKRSSSTTAGELLEQRMVAPTTLVAVAQPSAPPTLIDLASEINREHELCLSAVATNAALSH